MAGIQKRTVFMVADNSHTMDGQTPALNFEDWASCVTSIGTCMEPFMPNFRVGVGTLQTTAQYDNRDQMAMINKIITVGKGQLNALIADGVAPRVHSLSPQVFRLRA